MYKKDRRQIAREAKRNYVESTSIINDTNVNKISASNNSTSFISNPLCCTNESNYNYTNVINTPSSTSLPSFEDENSDHQESHQNIKSDLQQWSIKYQIPQSATTALLHILKRHKCFNELPADCRTLLNTPRISSVVKLAGGEYSEFKWKETLSKYVCEQNLSEVQLQINIDGIPLFNSTNKQFWPILGSLVGSKEVFTIGIYYGQGKPTDVDEFLKPFVQSANELYKNGIEVENKIVSFKISAFICDAPARAFISGIKNHNGYFACGKCTTKGVRKLNRLTFPEVNAPLRTNQSVRDQDQLSHHNRSTILAQLPVDLVQDIPYEYMHLICLGIVRKLIYLWTTTKKSAGRIQRNCINNISESLCKFRHYTPCEFSRKPRAVKEIDHWKATELRQFLLYTGIVVLQQNLGKHEYQHFLCLSVATSLLIRRSTYEKYNKYANELLIYFVNRFSELYGGEFISYNVHGLVHLAQDSLRHGALDTFSAFKFENYLQFLKGLVSSPTNPLQQVTNRILERDGLNSNVKKIVGFQRPAEFLTNKDIPCGTHFSLLQTDRYTIKTNQADSCVVFKNGDIGIVVSFLLTDENINLVIYRRYLNKSTVFELPCSSYLLEIVFVGELSKELIVEGISNIKYKCYRLPYRNGFVISPLVHQFEN